MVNKVHSFALQTYYASLHPVDSEAEVHAMVTVVQLTEPYIYIHGMHICLLLSYNF